MSFGGGEWDAPPPPLLTTLSNQNHHANITTLLNTNFALGVLKYIYAKVLQQQPQ